MKFVVKCLMLLSLMADAGALAETPTKVERSRFQLFSQVVSLPESGETTAATIDGALFELTDKWSLRTEEILASNAQGYFGGLQYTTELHKLLEHTNLRHEDFEFYLTGCLGKTYSERFFENASGFGFLAGGGMNYLPKHSERLQFDIFELRVARLPHIHGGLDLVVSTGVQVGF